MKNDSKSFVYAEVDVSNARFLKGTDLGIEFTNEIDVWAQMEFRARQQIKQLKHFGSLSPSVKLKYSHSLVYTTRQSFE